MPGGISGTFGSEEAEVVSSGIKTHFKVPCEGESQVWECQACWPEGEQGGSGHGHCSACRAARKCSVRVFCFSSEVQNSLRSLQGALLFTDSESEKNYTVFF